ncbi:hypothetical protein GP486_008636 [Trichoglossum hirsutum]|uniref:Uncharacterized protein n=1 Tax=Trichoglossum hirsutum TaxID=265104 RepID=A0A9P8IDW6_9PEZI|nr:hypothetical protein GP486_008636 [Trichoglossum hirsutum]
MPSNGNGVLGYSMPSNGNGALVYPMSNEYPFPPHLNNDDFFMLYSNIDPLLLEYDNNNNNPSPPQLNNSIDPLPAELDNNNIDPLLPVELDNNNIDPLLPGFNGTPQINNNDPFPLQLNNSNNLFPVQPNGDNNPSQQLNNSNNNTFPPQLNSSNDSSSPPQLNSSNDSSLSQLDNNTYLLDNNNNNNVPFPLVPNNSSSTMLLGPYIDPFLLQPFDPLLLDPVVYAQDDPFPRKSTKNRPLLPKGSTSNPPPKTIPYYNLQPSSSSNWVDNDGNYKYPPPPEPEEALVDDPLQMSPNFFPLPSGNKRPPPGPGSSPRPSHILRNPDNDYHMMRNFEGRNTPYFNQHRLQLYRYCLSWVCKPGGKTERIRWFAISGMGP